MKKDKVTKGNDNIFAEIGVPEPKATLIRSQIMSRITEIIKERGLNQTQAGKILGLDQSRVSQLMNGKLSLFSHEHLYKLLNSLEQDVEIIIKPKSENEKSAITSLLLAMQPA